MEEKTNSSVAANVGGTIVAILIALVVLAVVSMIVTFLASAMNYYMSSMRIEAATFFGGLIGAWAGIYAARLACDAVVKAYSGKAIFVTLVMLGLIVVFAELREGMGWHLLAPLSQVTATLVAGWAYFWLNEEM